MLGRWERGRNGQLARFDEHVTAPVSVPGADPVSVSISILRLYEILHLSLRLSLGRVCLRLLHMGMRSCRVGPHAFRVFPLHHPSSCTRPSSTSTSGYAISVRARACCRSRRTRTRHCARAGASAASEQRWQRWREDNRQNHLSQLANQRSNARGNTRKLDRKWRLEGEPVMTTNGRRCCSLSLSLAKALVPVHVPIFVKAHARTSVL